MSEGPHGAFARITEFSGRKKSSVVAERILEAINDGRFRPGDRLPAERRIAEELGVSRPPVREAISALQLAGVLEVVTGDGSYVRQSRDLPLSGQSAVTMLEQSVSPFEAMRARMALELGIVETAIDNAQPHDLELADFVLDHKMGPAIERDDIEAYFQANKDFHMAIAAATHNSLLQEILGQLFLVTYQPLWKEAVGKYFANRDHLRHYFNEHRKILQAVRDRDVDTARELIRNHFARTVKEVREML